MQLCVMGQQNSHKLPVTRGIAVIDRGIEVGSAIVYLVVEKKKKGK